MPTNKEIAEWLREAADGIEQEIAPLLGRVLSGPYTKKLRERAALVEQSGWQLIETAPRDRTPIIGWCDHEADLYYEEEGKRLTVYAAHAEGMSHVPDGPHVLVWGGEYSEHDTYTGSSFTIPDWWFRAGSDFEEAANPTHWMPLPELPQKKEVEE